MWSRVHLIGVSHGSKASAKLVRETIQRLKPSAVVLELCEERFMTVSLEAQMRPRNNATLMDMYDSKSETARAKKMPMLRLTPAEQIFGALRFASSQGMVGGAFVIMGLTIGYFQKIARASSGDEFLTAMAEAEALRVPVLLADAAQNDTLRSLGRVLSLDTLRPDKVLDGVQSLAFSALGVGAPQGGCEWVNIPRVYSESDGLFFSLLPILLVAFAPSLLALDALPPPTHDASLFAQLGELKAQVLDAVETLVNAASFLFIVRLAKIIGAERDELMARNIQAACRDHAGRDLVVVIGMLHCNGIARRLVDENMTGS